MSSTMICMTDTSVIPFPTLNSTYTRNSSTVAGPLLHVPSRSARSSSPLSSDTSSDLSAYKSSESVDYALQSRSAARMRYDSGSSSSSSTLSDEIRPIVIPRSKRVASHSTVIDSHDTFTPITPAPTPVNQKADVRSFGDLEDTRQTPLCDISDEEVTLRPFSELGQTSFCKFGQLRLEGSTEDHARHGNVTYSRAPVTGTLNAKQPLQPIRKKSGQPVKSSLKSARRPELHVVTDGSFAKSEPATPTHAKSVKFDSKLEHVKLFLAEQKPLAVSRDGSPTSDTSGDEFPSFIYGDSSRENQQVKMLVPNIPVSPKKGENVALQGLVLSQDQHTITGSVRVRNIAYEKWLAVRFTFDWWQTTSEVTARYDKSVEGGIFDVFTFTFRLHDIWSRIEEETILFALRYVVGGQEYWDNNGGQNYRIKFVLSGPSSALDSETSLRDLDLRLEDLVKAKSSPLPISPYRLGRSFSADHQYYSFAKSFSTRYDLASAHKKQWVGNISPQPNRHTRTHTHPSGVSAITGSTVAPRFSTLSAQEINQAISSQPKFPLSVKSSCEATDDIPMLPARSETKLPLSNSPNPPRLQDDRERNHRRGYVDRVMEGSPNLRKTPTGSPLRFDATSNDTTAQLPRTRTFPLTAEKLVPMVNSPQQSTLKPSLSIEIAPVDDGGSREPTPCETSQSSSSSASYTPLYSPGPDYSRSGTSYKQFLDQFCFYTGTDSLLREPSETLPRSHSTSSIERYLLSHSPPQSFSSHLQDLPARFSLDPSISTTPTAVHAQ